MRKEELKKKKRKKIVSLLGRAKQTVDFRSQWKVCSRNFVTWRLLHAQEERRAAAMHLSYMKPSCPFVRAWMHWLRCELEMQRKHDCHTSAPNWHTLSTLAWELTGALHGTVWRHLDQNIRFFALTIGWPFASARVFGVFNKNQYEGVTAYYWSRAYAAELGLLKLRVIKGTLLWPARCMQQHMCHANIDECLEWSLFFVTAINTANFLSSLQVAL